MHPGWVHLRSVAVGRAVLEQRMHLAPGREIVAGQATGACPVVGVRAGAGGCLAACNMPCSAIVSAGVGLCRVGLRACITGFAVGGTGRVVSAAGGSGVCVGWVPTEVGVGVLCRVMK